MTKACRAVVLSFAVFFLLYAEYGSAGPILPVYVEDNHAGSFYRLAGSLNWSEQYQLVLFDRHSDASAVLGSDTIRDSLAASQDSAE